MSNEKQTGVMTPDELEYLQTHEMSRRDFLLDSLAVGGLAAHLVWLHRCPRGLGYSRRMMK